VLVGDRHLQIGNATFRELDDAVNRIEVLPGRTPIRIRFVVLPLHQHFLQLVILCFDAAAFLHTQLCELEALGIIRLSELQLVVRGRAQLQCVVSSQVVDDQLE
jgi:hypothetical protein